MQPESDEEKGNNQRNPVKKGDRTKEFREIGNSNKVFTNQHELYEAAIQHSKTFKTVRNEHPIHHEFEIVDFSLNARGTEEDEVYVKYPFYRANIRRGNTFLYDKVEKKAEIARKGLMKFFDISQSSLKAIKEGDMYNVSKKSLQNHNAVFKEIENSLAVNKGLEEKDRAKVHIFRLNKANGENAQVSFNAKLGEWVICSKNVSIFVKNAEEIKVYVGERYGFANLIAETWFNLISNLNEMELEELKKDLADKTIVGEYCGNPQFQHLVKYAQITIYFYAVVEKQSPFSCLPPNKAFQLLERHKIPIVKNYEKSYVGAFTDFKEIGSKMLDIFREVSTASIFEEEEGSVVYFVLEQPQGYFEHIVQNNIDKVTIPENWKTEEKFEHVVSLGKLKTLEYRILRKLREKLKYFTMKPKGKEQVEDHQKDFKKFQEKYASFEKECFDLVKEEKLNKPLEYYFCAALLAMEFAFKHKASKNALTTLSEHYLDFISVVLFCIENKKPISEEIMVDYDLHEKLRGETWENYGIEIVGEYPKLLERIVPKYAKIKETMDIKNMGNEGGEENEESDN